MTNAERWDARRKELENKSIEIAVNRGPGPPETHEIIKSEIHESGVVKTTEKQTSVTKDSDSTGVITRLPWLYIVAESRGRGPTVGLINVPRLNIRGEIIETGRSNRIECA